MKEKISVKRFEVSKQPKDFADETICEKYTDLLNFKTSFENAKWEVLPISEPTEMKFGWVAFKVNNNKEEVKHCWYKMFPEATVQETITLNSLDEFIEIYNTAKAKTSDIDGLFTCLYKCDDPKILKVGFVFRDNNDNCIKSYRIIITRFGSDDKYKEEKLEIMNLPEVKITLAKDTTNTI